MRPVVEATATIPWLPAHEAVVGVARHLRCTPEAAELRIVGEGKAGRIKARGAIEIKACGAIEGRQVSLLPAAWHGTIDLTGATMRPPVASYEITNVELCLINLIATGLQPAPAEKARWPAAEAIVYLVTGVPLSWPAWQGAGASPAEITQAEIKLGEVIRAGVPAWGWPRPSARGKKKQRIPAAHFDPEMIENKALPVSVARPSKVIVRIDGTVGTAPPQRSADYRGPHWEGIEFDSAALRQARRWPTQAADAGDQDRAATAAAAGTKPKKRHGTRPEKQRGTRGPLRGPLPKTTERVVTAIKDDIRAGRLTIKEGRLFKGKHRALQKELMADYRCGTGTLRNAQDIALSELKSEPETPTKL
jgi:hypothetical protein